MGVKLGLSHTKRKKLRLRVTGENLLKDLFGHGDKIKQKSLEKYIMIKFIILTPHQISLRRPNQRGRDKKGMQHVCRIEQK